ncbi:MAG: hypothetical protein R6V10_05610 [bacterium]
MWKKERTTAVVAAAVVALLFFICLPAHSEVKLTDGVYLDGYIRPRVEFDDRDFDGSTSADQYATLRTRLGFRVDRVLPDTVFYILLADSRTMGYNDPYLTGEPEPPNKPDRNLGVSKVWIRLDNLLTDNFYLKVGRMSNDQGRARIMGPGNWSYAGPRTYDGIKAGYLAENFSLKFWSFYGIHGDRHWYPDPDQYPDHSVPDEDIDYKYDHTLNGFDLHLFQNRLQLLAFVDLDQARVKDVTEDEENPASVRYTAALYFHQGNPEWKEKGGPRFELDYAYQFGTVGTAAGEADVSAWLCAGDLYYSAGGEYAPWIGAGWDVTSGDSGANRLEAHYFYDYYYSRHGYRGRMDLFKDPYGTASLGLQDYVLRTGFSPHKSIRLQADAHYFRVEQPYLSVESSDEEHELGYELDLMVRWQMRKGIKAKAAYMTFWPSDDWKGEDADPAGFSYLALIASF